MNVILTTLFSPWSAYSGGGQQSTHNLAKALSRRGHTVTVVYAKPPWERVDVPNDLPYTVRWATLPALRSRRDATLRPLAAVSVARTVRGLLGPDTVVHSQGEEGALLPYLRRRHPFPFLLTPRFPSLPAALLRPTCSVFQKLALALLQPKYLLLGAAVRGADFCCPPSAFAADLVQRAYGLAPARLRVVPNGVSDAFLQVERVEEASKGPIVFFGRLARAKGVDLLLEALALLMKVPSPCLIIGRGEEAAALSQQVRRLGLESKVQLKGWRAPSEIASILARASMAVLPSREESFGNAIAEAMAAGTPVISTRVGSIPEVVVHEQSGLLVAPESPHALASSIQRLTQAPLLAEQLGRGGQRRVRSLFTWDVAAQRFESIYASALTTSLTVPPI